MVRGNRPYARRVAVAASIAVAAGFLAQPGPSSADVTAVKGSAFGYFADNIVTFGSARADTGPVPVVTLPPGGSATPLTNEAATGLVQYGPTLFSSGVITVSTQGTTGPGGTVISSSTVRNINTSGEEVFTAGEVKSTCTATESGVSGTTSVVNGVLKTSQSGSTVTIDAVPAIGTAHTGQLESVGDSYRYVFNEQIPNEDGSLTVNAVHAYLLGPNVTGDVIIGQSVCGITATGATTTTQAGGGTTSTTQAGGGTTSTTQATGGTTSTTQATGGTTSTTLNTGVTTTLPAGGVTTSTILNTVPPAPGPLFGSINVSELIRQIVCPILQQLAADSFLRPFIEPFLVAFGCTA